MAVDDDIASFNRGFNELFKAKPINHTPVEVIKDETQKAAWQQKRTRRTQTDTHSMVSSYPHHEGDKAWLVAQFQTLPMHKREAAMMEYAARYSQAHESEVNTNKKDGQARKTANLWLVELISTLSKK